MSKFIRSAVLAASLVGVALVVQGCGGTSTSISGSKKCAKADYPDLGWNETDGREVKASCSKDQLDVAVSAPMKKDLCDRSKQDILKASEKMNAARSHRFSNFREKVSITAKCSGGKVTLSTTCKMDLKNITGCNVLGSVVEEECRDWKFLQKFFLVGDEKTTVQSLVATDAKTEIFGVPDEFAKSIAAETHKVVNDVKVAMQSNSETSDPELVEKLLWMALGGLMVGAAFLAYHIQIVKRLQAREMSGKSVPSPSLEMVPPASTA